MTADRRDGMRWVGGDDGRQPRDREMSDISLLPPTAVAIGRRRREEIGFMLGNREKCIVFLQRPVVEK